MFLDVQAKSMRSLVVLSMHKQFQVPIIKLGLFDLLALVWSACDEVRNNLLTPL
jgi:hypothetical protein